MVTTPAPVPRERAAVVGAGVAGLTAAYLLQRRFDVTLFEADHRLGGHAHTHELTVANGGTLNVDSGFLVHNVHTYPNLLRLFGELGVATQASEMSMSVSCDGCGLEFAGARGFSGVFAQRKNLVNPRFLSMLAQVKRFHRAAKKVLADPQDHRTLGAFIVDQHFSRYFAHHFLLPVVACVWSCGFAGAREYPARYLFSFLENHGMLAVRNSPQWRTVTGGSRSYVEQAAKNLSAVVTGTPVRSVARVDGRVEITDDADQVHHFDRIVVATHPDQALALLTDPSEDERTLLSTFSYLTSRTLLHTDPSVLPRTPGARASWNYRMAGCDSDDHAVRVHYDISRLQLLQDDHRYLVTLNDDGAVHPDSVIEEMHYAHPTYTVASVAAQKELGRLNDGRTAFAGAWQGWGFHEDGCASGVRAAQSFGVVW